MKMAAVRKFVLALPETTEEPHFAGGSFRVKGKIFTTIPVGGKHLRVYVDPVEGAALLANTPGFEQVVWGEPKTDMVQVDLAVVDERLLLDLLEDAWRMKAPKRVVAAYDAAHEASDST
jgi:hypothetical protein